MSNAFFQRWDNCVPAIITCGGLCGAYINSLDPDVHPQFRQAHLLWDTGATISMISKRFAAKMSLTPIGKARTCNCTGNILVDMYKVNLLLPNNIEVENLTVLADELPDADFLIGMDIINLCDFAITHKVGKTKFSFQIPSAADIQF